MHCPELLLLLALIQSTTWDGSTAVIVYEVLLTHHDDPEAAWTPGPAADWDSTNLLNSDELGLTFAGKCEFPYVVDITVPNIVGVQDDLHGTGSLITEDVVLTGCRVVDILEGQHKFHIARVSFSRNWLYDYTKVPAGVEWGYAGARNVVEMAKHSRCNVRESLWTGGILRVESPIPITPPYINFIELNINYRVGVLGDFELSHMGPQRRLCYIASYGKPYHNVGRVDPGQAQPLNMVENYKVKFRVYWEHPDICNHFSEKMCPNVHYPRDCRIANPFANGRQLMCFKSRGKVGGVCDHDKGAPLVCDGLVLGFVHLAAKERYCNSLLPLPFWVAKTSVVGDEYFAPVLEDDQGERDADGTREKTRTIGAALRGNSSADSLFNIYSVQRLLLILSPFIHY